MPVEKEILDQTISVVDESTFKCNVCQKIIQFESEKFEEIKLEHIKSDQHIINLSLSFIKHQAESEKKNSEILIDWQEAEAKKAISKMDYQEYLQCCVDKIIQKDLSNETQISYKNKLKYVLDFLVDQKLNHIDVKAAYQYMQENFTSKDYVVVNKLLKDRELKFSKNQKNTIYRLIEDSKSSRNLSPILFKKYAYRFLSDLEKENYLSYCVIYLLALNGMPLKQIFESTIKQIRQTLVENSINYVGDVECILTILEKIEKQQSFKETDLLIKKCSQRETRKILQSARTQIQKQSNDKDYNKFLDLASVQAFSQAKKKNMLFELNNSLKLKVKNGQNEDLDDSDVKVEEQKEQQLEETNQENNQINNDQNEEYQKNRQLIKANPINESQQKKNKQKKEPGRNSYGNKSKSDSTQSEQVQKKRTKRQAKGERKLSKELQKIKFINPVEK